MLCTRQMSAVDTTYADVVHATAAFDSGIPQPIPDVVALLVEPHGAVACTGLQGMGYNIEKGLPSTAQWHAQGCKAGTTA